MLPVELLEILACPVCKGQLQYDAAAEKLNCFSCGLAFPVRDDIPVMLADQAEPIPKRGSDDS